MPLEMLALTLQQTSTLYVHIVVIAFFSLSALGLIHLIIQKRWMMLRHTLDPCYARFELVMESLLFLTSTKPA